MNAWATGKDFFNRDAFDLSAGKGYGFNMDVTLRIPVEAAANQQAGANPMPL